MNESSLFLITFILYILSAFFYFFFLFSKKENLAKTGFGIAFLGLLIHTLALVSRTFESGHA
ncbi:MAG: c-type cytochrome biogenesis protein CcsB, partial [Candidatus Aminicenantes bacterium]|nr:c-type cytochrome biogenesis protein CcsB [Candidatus Aminicenantes bacterium]